MCSPGRCARWRFRTPYRMRSWPGWISSRRPKRWRSSARCWGGSFPMSCSQAIAPQDEDTLQAGLAQLVAAELLYQRGRPPRARYLFKHALIQDVAYASLLKSTRQQVHQQIAQVLESPVPRARRDPTGAGRPALHRRGLRRAGGGLLAAGGPTGQRPLGQSGSHQPLTAGIELLKTLPETPAHTQQALTLHIALGAALKMAKGHGSARGGARLHPGTRVVSAGGRDARAGPGPVWAVAVLSGTATVAHGARARGNAAAPGAT